MDLIHPGNRAWDACRAVPRNKCLMAPQIDEQRRQQIRGEGRGDVGGIIGPLGHPRSWCRPIRTLTEPTHRKERNQEGHTEPDQPDEEQLIDPGF